MLRNDLILHETMPHLVGVVNPMQTLCIPLCCVGPVMEGKLAQVAGKRWRLDIGARQEVSLQLSSVDLPGGAQVST